ncbi:disintegrin and metalloproteinase domain-containing protein 2 [Heterocephalus glaber]|uniref:Disintegrin and metalloproteinase domain-containing protein 2 n=1 Tax=Heterocephalus glaber TaxID=10181 RepID=A0AAX6PCD9_HETGA|nr:disintegrin and metalloproteinase domain-containing protein 2 [Heterocephalus glaber]
MLSVLLLLSGLRALGEPLTNDSERLRVQITVPEKMGPLTSDDSETEVSYKIAIEGTTYIVNLTQKTFLPYNFKVYGYDDAGIMKPLEEEVQNFCYYQGYIEGYPKSLVIITTCTGLRGVLQFENISYAIEPLESSVGFEHILYQIKQENKDVSLHTLKNTDLKNMTYKIQTVKPSSEFFQYIELHLIVEKDLYKHLGSTTATVTRKIFQLVGLMNGIFSSFNLTVILASLELWTDENKVPTTGDVNELLHQFQDWKKSYLVLRPHDVAFLLIYREAPSYIGAVFQGMVCDKDYGGGIALHPKSMNLDSFAVILVQLLSLSMGITYDDVNQCHCPGAVCVMNPEAIHSGGVKIFSDCSMNDFARFTSKPMSQCLQNQPRLQTAYQGTTCGNKIVEAGETCDCGTEEECNRSPPVCCDPITCRLKDTSKCFTGDCCENCEFKSSEEICRNRVDECDLPEFCNGSSADCQEDLFILNGHPCGENKWICMNGKCVSGKTQCEAAFGEGVDFGTRECYEQLNSRNDIAGNCGIRKDGSYTPCAPNNLKCGKLVCVYNKMEVNRNKHATTIYANINGEVCVSLEYPLNYSNSNEMWVQDGTVCDTQKVCRNKECVADSFLGYDCTPATCNNNGVCNNKKACQCYPGYLPPDCSIKIPVYGAQFDPERHYIKGVYQTKPKNWPFLLIIPFLIIFSVLIAIVVKVYFQRKKWRTEDYISEEDLESESEHKDSKEKSG